jgi:hypothetical protein
MQSARTVSGVSLVPTRYLGTDDEDYCLGMRRRLNCGSTRDREPSVAATWQSAAIVSRISLKPVRAFAVHRASKADSGKTATKVAISEEHAANSLGAYSIRGS